LAKSIYQLYKDLLLLETFAIMTYCSFSKILKKHDKVTGYATRAAFMANIVNNANFTNYPTLLEMINRCERMYEEVSHRLVQDGKEVLYEDERLFINMIVRLNEQVLDTVDEDGAARPKEPRRASIVVDAASSTAAKSPMNPSKPESIATSTLRSMVEENDAMALAAHVSEGHNDDDSHSRKRGAGDNADAPLPKYQRA
jgi:SPX domain